MYLTSVLKQIPYSTTCFLTFVVKKLPRGRSSGPSDLKTRKRRGRRKRKRKGGRRGGDDNNDEDEDTNWLYLQC